MLRDRLLDHTYADIEAIKAVSGFVDTIPGMHFVMTGSYSIEALTGRRVVHNDIDANVFMSSFADGSRLPKDLLEILNTDATSARLVGERRDRLEFELSEASAVEPESRKFELRMIDAIGVLGDESKVLYLENSTGIPFQVPLIRASIKSPSGEDISFMVKSLPYAIATWAIRLSGLIQNEVRPPRQSDIDHLRLLLSCDHIPSEVLRAMSHHPQMPMGTDRLLIMEKALSLVI